MVSTRLVNTHLLVSDMSLGVQQELAIGPCTARYKRRFRVPTKVKQNALIWTADGISMSPTDVSLLKVPDKPLLQLEDTLSVGGSPE